MTTLMIELYDEAAGRVLSQAAGRGAAAEAVSERFPPRRRRSFMAMGGRWPTNTARRHSEIITDPYAGKAARDR